MGSEAVEKIYKGGRRTFDLPAKCRHNDSGIFLDACTFLASRIPIQADGGFLPRSVPRLLVPGKSFLK